jgi:predicted nucleotidyltransferase
MDRERIIDKLRQHEAELKRAGITRLSLFGSMARGERGNDVDLMAEFDAAKRLTLLDMAGLEMRLAEIVGMPVDLAPAKMLKEPVKEEAQREAVLAF